MLGSRRAHPQRVCCCLHRGRCNPGVFKGTVECSGSRVRRTMFFIVKFMTAARVSAHDPALPRHGLARLPEKCLRKSFILWRASYFFTATTRLSCQNIDEVTVAGKFSDSVASRHRVTFEASACCPHCGGDDCHCVIARYFLHV